MVTLNEQSNGTVASRESGLLGKQVERDMANTLNDFGSQTGEPATEGSWEAPKLTFGYGIPMAGVRYYTYTSAE